MFILYFRENLAGFKMMAWKARIQSDDGSLDSVLRPKTNVEQVGPIKCIYQLTGNTLLEKECIDATFEFMLNDDNEVASVKLLSAEYNQPVIGLCDNEDDLSTCNGEFIEPIIIGDDDE